MFHYLIRLDDACPTMDRDKWERIERILDKYEIRPMVGIVPYCQDDNLKRDIEDTSFWEKAITWQNKGWTIAMHGYNHVYISQGGMKGLNPMWSRSEFAGLSLEEQREKIRKGVAIMREHSINPKYFFAPSHTFDENTLEALRMESDIRIISDTIAVKPYRYKDFVFIPQLGGHCVEMRIPGIWTFCLHPSTMKEDDFLQTERFLKNHQNEFCSFDQLCLEKLKGKDLFSQILSWFYFTRRKLQKRK